jgi:hypothetical protein
VQRGFASSWAKQAAVEPVQLLYCLQQQVQHQVQQAGAAQAPAQQQAMHHWQDSTCRTLQLQYLQAARLVVHLPRWLLQQQCQHLFLQGVWVVAAVGPLLRLRPRLSPPAAQQVLMVPQMMMALQQGPGSAGARGSYQLGTPAAAQLARLTAASGSSAYHQTHSPQQSGRHLLTAMQRQAGTAAQHGAQHHHHHML